MFLWRSLPPISTQQTPYPVYTNFLLPWCFYGPHILVRLPSLSSTVRSFLGFGTAWVLQSYISVVLGCESTKRVPQFDLVSEQSDKGKRKFPTGNCRFPIISWVPCRSNYIFATSPPLPSVFLSLSFLSLRIALQTCSATALLLYTTANSVVVKVQKGFLNSIWSRNKATRGNGSFRQETIV